MVRKTPGQGLLAQVEGSQGVGNEVEVAARQVLQREGRKTALFSEPGDLVVELAQIGLLRVAEQRARKAMILGRMASSRAVRRRSRSACTWGGDGSVMRGGGFSDMAHLQG